MALKAYVKELGEYSWCYVPFESYKWTGRWKMHTLIENGPPGYKGKIKTTTLSFERRFGIFPFNLFFTTWEEEKDIVFRDEEITIMTCGSNKVL